MSLSVDFPVSLSVDFSGVVKCGLDLSALADTLQLTVRNCGHLDKNVQILDKMSKRIGQLTNKLS